MLGFVNGKVNREAVFTTHVTEHGMRDRFCGGQGLRHELCSSTLIMEWMETIELDLTHLAQNTIVSCVFHMYLQML